MKIRTIDTEFIVYKWMHEDYSIAQISKMDIPNCVCLKRIRNIVYGGRNRCRNNFEKEVYGRFRIKFLELKDVPAAIAWVYDNQPSVRITERTVYRIINDRFKHHNK